MVAIVSTINSAQLQLSNIDCNLEQLKVVCPDCHKSMQFIKKDIQDNLIIRVYACNCNNGQEILIIKKSI